jgi:hypothetical protein
MKCFAALLPAIFLAGCGGRHSADSAMRSCVPPGTVAVASIDLDRLRAAPVYSRLPSAARSIPETYPAAHRLLAAWNGSGMLIILHGGRPPAGATVVEPGISLVGLPADVEAGVNQHRTGKPGSAGLIDYASKQAGSDCMWLVARGGTDLPVTGNARNLNRLFRNIEYAVLSANPAAGLDLRLTALANSEPAAREFEESVRGALSLASAAESRNPQIASLLNSVDVRRTGPTATASLHVPASAIDALFHSFVPPENQ